MWGRAFDPGSFSLSPTGGCERSDRGGRTVPHAESGEPYAGRRRRGDPAKPVTIAYIAASAGVSVPTVSKVINGRSGVAPDTRARVEAAVEQYGYRRPDPAVRTDIMELVFRELESMWALEIIRGVERVAREHHVGVLLSEFDGQPNAVRGWINGTLTRRPHCVITVAQLSETERAQLRARGIPYVVFDPTYDLPDDIPFVGATNWSGGRAATRHLIELGHRDIALISGPDHVLCSRARHDGYRAAMDAAGIPVNPDFVLHAHLNRADGHAAACRLLGLPRRPTAIFAGNDLQALGVYQAAHETGLRIPQDLSVVGYDDLPIVAWLDPPMTTVHQPLTEMAAAATELALTLGRRERPAQTGIELATSLVVRGSTAPPPGP
ncbi:LacI family DNA-binding transcriptional regulator [Streptosporangiaceae bacterium NEAU-GS5]|nr:LacI family DNA-binding transcriptional regulator [Streptosporangiaceae bacterium NEAU-GS5]